MITPQHHKPRLDGLRAVAVGFVLLTHFMPSLERWLPGGNVGVRIFFVLSGYLISRILLQLRDSADSSAVLAGAIRSFYGRRALRILPVYFLALLLALCLGLVRADWWPWLLTFTSNWYMTLHRDGMGPVSPYWSLAVEEQFYLVWPWVILLLPRRMLHGAIVSTISVGIATRLIGLRLGMNSLALYANTLSACDALGLGSLLAYYEQTRAFWRWRALGRLGAAGLILAIGLYFAKILWPGREVLFQWYEITLALAGAFLVSNALREDPSPWGRLLDHPILRYLGRISYGIYALHMVVYGGIAILFAGVGFGATAEKVIRISLELPLSLIVPMLSYHLLELPLGRLKRYLPYPTPHTVEARDPLRGITRAMEAPAAE